MSDRVPTPYQKDDAVQWLLMLLSFLAALFLALAYVFALPENAAGVQKLLRDCIPSAIVALISVPTIYFILYKRGLT